MGINSYFQGWPRSGQMNLGRPFKAGIQRTTKARRVATGEFSRRYATKHAYPTLIRARKGPAKVSGRYAALITQHKLRHWALLPDPFRVSIEIVI